MSKVNENGIRFFNLSKKREVDLDDPEFDVDAELNPFDDDPFSPQIEPYETEFITDIDGLMAQYGDEDEEQTMDDFVRKEKPRQLDKYSRRKSGDQAGVYSSDYDELVRDVDDLEDIYDDPSKPGTDISAFYASNDEKNTPYEYGDPEDMYLTPEDPNYYKHEFNDESDMDDFERPEEVKNKITPEDLLKQYGYDENDKNDDESEKGENDNSEENPDEELEGEQNKDSKYEGIIRNVKGAYLVKKVKKPDDTYEELWVYNVGQGIHSDTKIRKAILAGTDIDPTKHRSEDGSQEAAIFTMGNVQFLEITGLPN